MNRYAFLLFLLGAELSLGTPVRYTFSGTGSGSVGQSSFSDALIDIIVLGDTSGIVTGAPDVFINPSLATTMEVPLIGTITITDSTQMFSHPASGIGIGDNTTGVALFSLYPSPPYDLATNFGPLFNASPDNVNQFIKVSTNYGTLNMTSWTNVTFVASVVPEPCTPVLLLIAAGIALAAPWRCRGQVANNYR